jgi:hypothetical protein
MPLSPLATTNRKPRYFNEIGLIDEIGKIIKAYNSVRYENDLQKKIEYLPCYPDYVFDLTNEASKISRPSRLICYDIIKKDSGSLGKERFDRDKRIKPILIESRPVILDQGTPQERQAVMSIYEKHYDILLRFDCMSATDRDSLELIREFEKIMEAHTLYLETGVQRFAYNGRTSSFFSRDTHYKSRTCHFFAQVQELWNDIDEQINTINLEYLNFTSEILF